MPDLWFVVGLAMGVVVTGFCAIGSFDRGADSVRRRAWLLELSARQLAQRRSGLAPFVPYGEKDETRLTA